MIGLVPKQELSSNTREGTLTRAMASTISPVYWVLARLRYWPGAPVRPSSMANAVTPNSCGTAPEQRSADQNKDKKRVPYVNTALRRLLLLRQLFRKQLPSPHG